jgi:predicted membrane protein (TIGR00267 family)
MNSFDGILTVIGIIMGSYLAGVLESKTVIFTGLATSFAMSVSGVWGTFLTETAERKKKLHDLGRHILTDLSNTKIAKAQRFASIVIAIIDGITPVIIGLTVLFPFFFASIIGITASYYISMAVALTLLAILGGLLGIISKENVFYSVLRMFVAGIICIGLIFFLERLS